MQPQLSWGVGTVGRSGGGLVNGERCGAHTTALEPTSGARVGYVDWVY